MYGSDVVRQLFSDQMKVDLEARARLAGESIDALVQNHQAGQVDALCKKLGESTNTRITVVLPSGEVIGDSHENPHDMDNHRAAARNPRGPGRPNRPIGTL